MRILPAASHEVTGVALTRFPTELGEVGTVYPVSTTPESVIGGYSDFSTRGAR